MSSSCLGTSFWQHQAEKFGQRGSTSYLPQKTSKMFSLGARLCSEGIDLPKESELLSLGARLCSEEIDHSASRSVIFSLFMWNKASSRILEWITYWCLSRISNIHPCHQMWIAFHVTWKTMLHITFLTNLYFRFAIHLFCVALLKDLSKQ